MDEISEKQLSWKRPLESVPFPHIWHRFESKSKNGKNCNIRIEDLTPNRFEEVLDFMMKYFLTGETLCVALKLFDDEVSVKNLQLFFREAIEARISLIAVLDDSLNPEIMGVQLLSVVTKNDSPSPEVSGEKFLQVMSLLHDVKKNVDPFCILNSDAYLHGRGLCVKPEYRGLNIGHNIFLTLEKVARAFNISGSMFFYTSIQSQTLADKNTFKVYNEIIYDEYKNENDEVIFPVRGTKSLKLMGIKYL